MNYKKTLIGSSLAFILATSCCWLPALVIIIGGGSTLMALSKGLENMSALFLLIGVVLLGWGLYKYKKRKSAATQITILNSTITCPHCAHSREEEMPTDACQYFYECQNCKVILKPKASDCCVYCSYGTAPCPPIQLDQNCC